MAPLGEPTSLRQGFGGILRPERRVLSLHVLPEPRLLLLTVGHDETGSLLQYRIQPDGGLSRRHSLGAPELDRPISLALLNEHARPSARLYVVTAAMSVDSPPDLLVVDPLRLEVTRRVTLRQADGQAGCGALLPDGDILLPTLGSSAAELNASDVRGSAVRAAPPVRVSHLCLLSPISPLVPPRRLHLCMHCRPPFPPPPPGLPLHNPLAPSLRAPTRTS